MSWKRMIFGEKTPDKNDPRYKDRYQKEVEAGRKTARFLKIDKISAKIQTFASNRPRTFLAIVSSLMIFCFIYNVYCIASILSRPDNVITATQIQRQKLEKRKAINTETKAQTPVTSPSEQHHTREEVNVGEQPFPVVPIESLSQEKEDIEKENIKDTQKEQLKLETIELDEIQESEDFG